MRRVFIVLLLIACVGIVQAEQRSISVNYCNMSGGWGYHDHVMASSDPYAGYENEPNQVPHILATTGWNEYANPGNGDTFAVNDQAGTATGATLLVQSDFDWHTSWYQNIDNTYPDLTERQRNALRLVVGFNGFYPGNHEGPDPISTIQKVPYGKYHVVTYMNPNREDDAQYVGVGDQEYYYLAEHADTLKARLQAGGETYIEATDTVGPASQRANVAIFTDLTDPDMELLFETPSNSGISAFQIIAAEEAGDVSTAPSPATNSVAVPIDALLSWTAPANYTPTSYDIYLGEYGDPNWANAPVASGVTATTYDPVDFDYNKNYVWRVDSTAPDGTVHTGDLWYFQAEGDPMINVQPRSIAVPVGGDSFFEIQSILTDTYTWYKSTDAVVDTPDDDVEVQSGPSNVLNIENYQEADAGYYYCVLTNTIPDSNPVASEVASLETGKLEAHYPFDGDPNDAAADWDLLAGETDDSNITNTYETGIVGDAMRFARDAADTVYIPGSEEYFNFFTKGFTITMWVKPNSYDETNGFMTYVAKRSGDTGWNMFDTAFYYGQGFEAKIYPLGFNTDTGRLDDGDWHMVTCTYDAATQTLRAYVDGLEDGGPSVGEGIAPSTQVVTFGSYYKTGTGGWGYGGLLDDVKIYNYPLSFEEIGTEYAQVTGTTLCYADLFADLNDDCQVNFDDLMLMVGDWMGDTTESDADATGPARVVNWKFDETTGLTATDSTGNGFDGTLHSNFTDAAWIADGGRTGQAGDGALYCNGDPNMSVIATGVDPAAAGVGDIFVGTNPWSINLWVKFDGDPGMVNIGGFGDCTWDDIADTYDDRYFASYSGGLEFEYGDGGLFPGTSLVGGEWVMLTVTYDGSEAAIYHNGQQVGGQTVALDDVTDKAFRLNTMGDIVYAGETEEVPLKGWLDDFTVWDGALSAAQVAGMYEREVSCFGEMAYDVNNDCVVDMTDLSIIGQEWMECNLLPTTSCN
ncbi:hypothetical protein STSP2_01667 [Anaerohalosphaera lusitana]|uniref:Uncharacterized protein n=1 Tax=Anaerohalosphaera lusitana TaxID=1936003 RepID=A0A1U9NKN6_9BACT|nr:LamG-like jellyroll fold domain-containing protein [Anaerohalosphaera lusitana]AQT68502.1 hypothetical protein STSP2_01667 [Anaerohalosphaera lusitana]